MKHKISLFLLVLTLALAVLTVNAAKKNDEIQRMGIFISNFTEIGMFDIDIDDIDNSELIRFGIAHNIINNPKSTLKKCTLRGCKYGPSLMAGSAVTASVKRYFDLPVKNKSLTEYANEAEYDGDNYHFDAREWRDDTVYYAEVQNVSRERGIITMTGELYNPKKKSERPASFTATAKPHEWNGKDTWAILSLNVEWY